MGITSCGAVENAKSDVIGNSNINDDTSTIGTSSKGSQISDILFVSQYTNWAEGYQNNGYFIDVYGNVFQFDFSNDATIEQSTGGKSETLNYLLEIMLNNEPSYKVDMSSLAKCSKYVEKIDKNATISSKHNAFDAGQETLYAVISNGNQEDFTLLKISSTGDYVEKLEDKNAIKLSKCWDGVSFLSIE